MTEWDLSRPDWQDRIRQRQSLMPDLPLFTEEADIAAEFFDELRLPNVIGQPRMRDAAGAWARDIVRALFGSCDPKSGHRYVREIFALLPKGSSKTTYMAGLMLVALMMNLRPRAEFLFIGPTQAIAGMAFNQCAGMIDADDELKKRFWARDHLSTIQDRDNGSTLKIKTFDVNILTGTMPVGVMVDELHLIGAMAKSMKVMRQIRGGLEKNTEGFLVITSTQSDSVPTGVFRDELAQARRIRDGVEPGRTLPILYEFPPDIVSKQEKWENPENWPMVMPNLGKSVHLESLIKDWNSEKDKGKASVSVWASQHLNIEIGVGIGAEGWVGALYWDRKVNPALMDLDHFLSRCEVVVVGIDGGGLEDLLGMALLGREKDTRRWLVWTRAWAKEIAIERRKKMEAKLRDCEAEGSIDILPDDSTADIEAVADIIEQIHLAGLLPEENAIGVDPSGISEIVDEIVQRDLAEDPEKFIVGVRQGFTLQNAIKTTERRLAQGVVSHGGSILMNWCVGNARQQQKGNSLMITKEASDGKIDPLMGLFNAVHLMSFNPVASASAYSGERGLTML